MEAELLYYRRRMACEAAAAAAATDPNIRRIHLELARCYDARIAALDAEGRRAQIHLVSAA
jgi:hypothetical protein